MRALPLLICCTLLAAAERQWSGGGDGVRWSDAANWGGEAPRAGDGVTLGRAHRTSRNDLEGLALARLVIDAEDATLHGAPLSTPAISATGARIRIACPLSAPPLRAGTVAMCLVARSLRGEAQDDWRDRLPIAGRRSDARIHWPLGALGTDQERRAWGIAGTAATWEQVSAQWDGRLRIAHDGVRLALRSDDGSRLGIDRDGDGRIGAGEWAGTWGQGHGTQVTPVHGPLPAGIHRFRLQWEQGNGGASCSLLWSDAALSDGALDGWHVVPPAAFVDGQPLRIACSGRLELAGRITADEVRCEGPGRILLAAAPGATAAITIAGGELVLGGPGLIAGRSLSLASGARLLCNGIPQRLDPLPKGDGTIDPGGARLDCAGGDRLEARLAGSGTLAWSGAGILQLGAEPAGVAVTVASGAVRWPDGGCRAVVRLRAPLATVLALPAPPAGTAAFDADIAAPDGVPADLGLGIFAGDRHGAWQQLCLPAPLHPGRQHLRLPLDGLLAEPGPAPASAATPRDRVGVFLWSARACSAPLSIDLRPLPAPTAAPPPRLTALEAPPTAATGERWQLACRPQPFPSDPFDPRSFAFDAEVVEPDGAVIALPGFYEQPMRLADRGDRESAVPGSPDRFALRFRPRLAGVHRVRLAARWAGGAAASATISFTATGTAFDGWARVDARDPRFLSVGGRPWWPIGVNLRSVWDERDAEHFKTRLTPDRGSLSYEAYLRRFAAAGADQVEIWMAAWNLGLEWNASWNGFHGAGRYNQANAARLDRVLDLAWSLGMRVVLVVNNLGQGSDWCAPEWGLHPYNRANGGWLDRCDDLFTDARALDLQERHRRYLVARWAEHPAVACWKLWSEIDLTNMRANLLPWHDQASRRWQALDPWRHPITTHWCGSYHNPDRKVIALPGIAMTCIDAYHGGQLLAELIANSTTDPVPGKGLHQTGKPTLCTEFGGNWNGCPPEQLAAEIASAGWAGLVSGHAGAPMCWWYEFVDQKELFAPFRALRAFTAGEDLRGGDVRSVAIGTSGGTGALWARAWSRPGRMLGYVIDRAWGSNGGPAAEQREVRLRIAEDARPGPMTVAWWDADVGTMAGRVDLVHPGGALALAPPPFRRHLAWKLVRDPGSAAAGAVGEQGQKGPR